MSLNTKLLVNSRILSADHWTGVQRYLSAILPYLSKEISCVAPAKPLHGIRSHAWEQFTLPRCVDSDTLLWSPCSTGPLSITNQVVTIHDLVPYDYPESLNWRFAAWYRFLLPRLVKRARHIIAVSAFTKARLIEEFNLPEERVTVIWNGVDKRFQPNPDYQLNYVVNKLGIPSKHYVVALGSLEPRKNLKRLLQAWEKIVAQIPDNVWLVLAGAKGKSIVFDDVSFESLPPRVYLSGYVDDELLPSLYAGAIAAPYMSFYEGFGLPTLEAMACGTPVLTSNCTALPEVVGDAALTIDPFNVDSIAASLLLLLTDNNLRSALREKGLKRASHFKWQQAAGQTLRVLNTASTQLTPHP